MSCGAGNATWCAICSRLTGTTAIAVKQTRRFATISTTPSGSRRDHWFRYISFCKCVARHVTPVTAQRAGCWSVTSVSADGSGGAVRAIRDDAGHWRAAANAADVGAVESAAHQLGASGVGHTHQRHHGCLRVRVCVGLS
jgi:hypothetical protein